MKMAITSQGDGKLDGEACQACQTLDDYARSKPKMMARWK